ncbi:MAG: hypothetical protein U1E65_09895 [Myxococcota bacterium]
MSLLAAPFLLAWALTGQAPSLPDAPAPSPSPSAEPAAPAAPALPEPELSPEPSAEPMSLEERMARVEAELAQRDLALPPQSPITISGYLDFGFFMPEGDGSGIVQDNGEQLLRTLRPKDVGKYAWVFLGDILAPTVNSRGEAADLGPSPGVDRFDSVHSGGALGFLLNEANLTIDAGFGSRARATMSVDFFPRSGQEFSLGDWFDLDLAQLEVIVFEDTPTSLFVGKIEPVFGIEYKRRKASARFGITPSLVARYTTGSQLGVKARSKVFGGWLILAAALTNQSATQEQFHFSEEVDRNDGKTVSGRLALHIPLNELLPEVFSGALEIGGDALYGPQDRARDSDGNFLLYGADFEYQGVDLAVRGQVVAGSSPGRAVDRAYALELNPSGYVEIEYMFLPMLGALVRGELRDAWVSLGTERAYLTKAWRLTGGLRFVFSRNIVLKAEYLHNGEYGGLPEIKDDVFTSSLVVSY